MRERRRRPFFDTISSSREVKVLLSVVDQYTLLLYNTMVHAFNELRYFGSCGPFDLLSYNKSCILWDQLSKQRLQLVPRKSRGKSSHRRLFRRLAHI